jgi:UDP-N-acetylglucosamine 4-epimerase
MTAYDTLCAELRRTPKRWLVTGAAGFIGSHLVETLLALGQTVKGLDNFATGTPANLEAVASGSPAFTFIEGDIRDAGTCAQAVTGVDIVLHQAALGSVPRSIENPLLVHEVNVNGSLNVLLAARDAGVKRFVYAASSSSYGDSPVLPKVEGGEGRPLSPYAATKTINDLYAHVFARCYGMETVGLRYFNVFGPRQSPNGPYAAVIPQWFANLMAGKPCAINGDGETSRDFCYVANAVQANLLAGAAAKPEAFGEVVNIAVGQQTTLNQLQDLIRQEITTLKPGVTLPAPIYRDFRAGDVRHSLASIDKARALLGYEPTHSARDGLHLAAEWYVTHLG